MTWSFAIWIALMVALVATYILMGRRRTRHIDNQTEDVASTALPTIGEIAERQHSIRFGRPPTHTTSSWYPPPAKKKHRHA